MNFGASKRQSLSPPLPEETRNATYLGPQWMNPFGHLVARVVGVTELIAETTSSRGAVNLLSYDWRLPMVIMQRNVAT